MKTFWNELVATWRVMWQSLSVSWHNKEPLMGWLPRKVGMMYIALLLLTVVYGLGSVFFHVDTPIHRVITEFMLHSSILFVALMMGYSMFQSKPKPPQTKHWLVLCISIICLVIGLGTRLVNEWTDAAVIVPALALFLFPGEFFFVLWVHGIKPRRI